MAVRCLSLDGLDRYCFRDAGALVMAARFLENLTVAKGDGITVPFFLCVAPTLSALLFL
jgi:hypothetical protein